MLHEQVIGTELGTEIVKWSKKEKHREQKAAESHVKSQKGLTVLKELFIHLNALGKER